MEKIIIKKEDYSFFLEKYKGANAKIWLYNVSLRRIAIRLSFSNQKRVLYIIILGCEYIKGLFSWENSELSIISDKKTERYEINDKSSAFKLLFSGGYGLAEGDVSIVNNSFDDFLKD